MKGCHFSSAKLTLEITKAVLSVHNLLSFSLKKLNYIVYELIKRDKRDLMKNIVIGQ